jgi:hypothetical protein
MKKIILSVAFLAVVVSVLSSCAASKRDCNGVRHYKTKNGIYL